MFCESAFKHGIGKSEMLYAMDNPLSKLGVSSRIGGWVNTLVIAHPDGVDQRYIEVIYAESWDGTIIRFFHAMALTNRYRQLVNDE